MGCRMKELGKNVTETIFFSFNKSFLSQTEDIYQGARSQMLLRIHSQYIILTFGPCKCFTYSRNKVKLKNNLK